MTYFKITGITNGNLFKNNGTTAINNGDFITFAEGNAGLKFTPTGGGDGAFTAQASTSNGDGGLGGSTVTASIAVGMAVQSITLNEDTDSGAITVTKGGSETHFKVTGITGGTLYSDAGFTTQVTDGSHIAYGGATASLYFRPTAQRNTGNGGNGGFTVQASDGTNVSGTAVTSTITLTAVADAPTISSHTINEDATSQAVTITRSANDGAETTHYKVTSITGGTLYSDVGLTQQISDNGFVASGGATTTVYFKPTANRNSTTGGNGSFVVQASSSGADGGLGGSTVTSTVTLTPVADTPSVTNATTNEDTQSSSGLVISRNAGDGTEVTHFKITGITGGTLYKNDGTTQITNGTFITFAEGNAGLKFTPTANSTSNGSFVAEASTDGTTVAGSTATATITVTPIADTPSVTNASTTPSTQTTSGLVLSRAAVDGAEVTHFKITGITNGNLFKNNGTTAINNGDFITFAEGNAGLKFTPTGGGDGSFTAQASTSNGDGGLGGSTINATISVGAAVASPTINEDADSGAIAVTKGNAETHYKVTGITGGTLYSDAAFTTQVNDGDFIAQGGGGGNATTTNLYFRPTANRNTTTGGNGSFVLQASGAANDGGLTGSQITSTVTLTAIADTPSVSSHTVAEDATSQAVTITRSANDGTETSHYKITGITGGTLYSDVGLTTQITEGGFVASGGATTTVYFVPTANRNTTTGGNGGFTVQASKSNVDGGLGGSTVTSTLTLSPVADTPSVASPTVNEDTDSGAIAITRAAGDGAETSHYKITGITGGTLYSDAGFTTQISDGSFIASAGATTNVYFRPTANRNSTTGGNGSFTVQASSSNADGGLAGSTVTSTVTLTPIADTPSVTNAGTTPNTQTTTGLVLSRAAGDGAETTHFKITGITGGTLFKNDGTTQIANGDFITFAEGNAGLKFTPSNGSTSGAFTAQASKSAADGGLGGSTVNAAISVNSTPVASGTALSPPEGQVGTGYTFALPAGTFTDADTGDTLTYAATGLPAGLSINPQTGAISGNPTAVGSSTATITVTDSAGATATKTVTISVKAAPSNNNTTTTTTTTDTTTTTKTGTTSDSTDKGADGLRTVVRDTTTTTSTGTGNTGFGPTLAPTGPVTAPVITAPVVTAPVVTETAPSAPKADSAPAQQTVAPTGPAQVAVVPAALTAPSPQAFQVAVAVKPAGGGDALVVNAPVRDTVIAEGSRISVTMPSDSFAHTKADATVTLTATRSDGAALPGWMAFNPQTGTFEGMPPPGFKGEVVVKVVARDNEGREAVQTFKIVVGQAGQGNIAPGQGGEGRGQGQPQGGEGRPQGEGQPQGAPGRTGDAAPRDGAKQAVVKPVGRPSLTAQLRELSQEGRLAKQAALFGVKRASKAA